MLPCSICGQPICNGHANHELVVTAQAYGYNIQGRVYGRTIRYGVILAPFQPERFDYDSLDEAISVAFGCQQLEQLYHRS